MINVTIYKPGMVVEYQRGDSENVLIGTVLNTTKNRVIVDQHGFMGKDELKSECQDFLGALKEDKILRIISNG